MTLTGRLVRLRAFEPDDAEALWRWHHDDEAMRWMGEGYPESRFELRKRLENRAPNSLARVGLGIETRDGGTLIGACQLRDTSPEAGRAELDLYVGERDHWNRGYGTDALRVLCAYGFDTLRLHTIALTVAEPNEAARHIYRKVGFAEEGRLRESFRREGQWYDEIVMGLLEREFIRS